jgi:uncharacterized membrane protein YeaQ/YmgE (transglycosylase-associated protein family)
MQTTFRGTASEPTSPGRLRQAAPLGGETDACDLSPFVSVHTVSVVVILLIVVLALLLGGALLGLAFELVWLALIGLVIGALARLVLPGQQAIGWLGTIGAGIAGAILGGVLAHAFDWGGFVQFLLAIVVAAVLIAIFGGTRRAYA